MSAIQSESETQQPCWRLKTSSSTVDDLSELTRFTPALLSPRFRLSVGTLVLRGKGGILSLLEDSGAIKRERRLVDSGVGKGCY